MFNIDDIGFSEELYDQVEKEIGDIRSKIKKDLEKNKYFYNNFRNFIFFNFNFKKTGS
jgi:hypothetical protein